MKSQEFSIRTDNVADGKSTPSLYDHQEPWHSTVELHEEELPQLRQKSYMHRLVPTKKDTEKLPRMLNGKIVAIFVILLFMDEKR